MHTCKSSKHSRYLLKDLSFFHTKHSTLQTVAIACKTAPCLLFFIAERCTVHHAFNLRMMFTLMPTTVLNIFHDLAVRVHNIHNDYILVTNIATRAYFQCLVL